METTTPPLPPIIVVVGPTAVGKSRLALALARDFDAEIVSADSRQIYRYMDIGTAKPRRVERAQIRHHMLDLIEPSEAYSVQRYRTEAERVLRRIGASARTALVVGGTGFYIRALLNGLLLPQVPPNEALRSALRQRATSEGVVALHQLLQARDPASAERIHPNNLPRLVRALEIVEALGEPVPRLTSAEITPALYLGLSMDRSHLHEVARDRIHRQVEEGLIEETRLLLEMGYSADAPGLMGFGYRHIIRHLTAGLPLDHALEEYYASTRQYIRRQMTWFRADSRIHWIESDNNAIEQARRSIQSWKATAASASGP